MSLEETVGSALRRLRDRLARHRVEVAIDEQLPLFKGDPVLMEQLLVNLLENAARHTPPGTRVHVGAQRIGRELELKIADDGPGFTADIAPDSLFENFAAACRAMQAATGAPLAAAVVSGLAWRSAAPSCARTAARSTPSASLPAARCSS